MSAHSVTVDLSNFEQVVTEGSKRAPVLVDFWAPWCAPCRALTPVLEKLAVEYQGRFVLAKINSDENQKLAAQFGVRGIPNVKAFVDGGIRDEFSGALPESAVRAFLEGIVPSPAEELRMRAHDEYQRNKDAGVALQLLMEAKSLDANNETVNLDRAGILIDSGRHDEARAELDALAPLTQMDERVITLRAKLAIATAAAAAPAAAELSARITADAGDLDAKLQFAHLLVAQQNYQEALDQLLDIVRRDRGFRDDAARKTMLQIFSVLSAQEGNADLVGKYRKLLASAMH